MQQNGTINQAQILTLITDLLLSKSLPNTDEKTIPSSSSIHLFPYLSLIKLSHELSQHGLFQPALELINHIVNTESPHMDTNELYELIWLRAQLHSMLGEHRAAIGDTTWLLAITPDNDQCLHIRAENHYKLGNLEQATRDLDCIQPQTTSMTALIHLRVEILIAQGKKQEALPYLTQALRAEPENLTIRAQRAWLHYQRTDMWSALQDINFILKQDPNNTDINNLNSLIEHKITINPRV